jgi:hypothetical protein
MMAPGCDSDLNARSAHQRHGWQRIAIIERKTDGPVSEKYRRAQGQ